MYKYLFLFFLFSATACMLNKEIQPQKKTNQLPKFVHDEKDSYYLLLESDTATYLEEVAIAERYIIESDHEGVRVNHLYFRDRNLVFVYFTRFENLISSLGYKKQIEAAGVFGDRRELMPISMHNYRVLLGKEKTFLEYCLFYQKNITKE